MTLEESKEVIPMMEAMITQIEEQQNIMAEMLQEIQEKDEKLMCFQEQEERLQQLEKELSELLQILSLIHILLMPQGALLRRGRSDSFTPAKPEEDAVGNQCRIRQKGGIVSWRYFTLQ